MNSGGLYIYTPSKLSSVGPQGQGIVSIVSLKLKLFPNDVWGRPTRAIRTAASGAVFRSVPR